jgi:hypothetical protein
MRNTKADAHSQRKAADDAGAEIAAAILALREEEISFAELFSLVIHHIPTATVADVIAATQRRFDA